MTKLTRFLETNAHEGYSTPTELAALAKEQKLFNSKKEFNEQLQKWCRQHIERVEYVLMKDSDVKRQPYTLCNIPGVGLISRLKILPADRPTTQHVTKMLAGVEKRGFGYSEGKVRNALKTRFSIPPFSVLNTKDGAWTTRRRQWMDLGIKSEEGRKEGLTYQIPVLLADGRDGGKMKTQTSVFDPVLCELMYSWFCKPGGVVLDPFAGGSVRGIVAAMLGRKYWGCELRPEQVAANNLQKKSMKEFIKDNKGFPPKWVEGDSAEQIPAHAPQCDFIFTCPPYGNLEVYSDEKNDISNMEYDDFLIMYREIIKVACSKLKDNRFACYVVTNYREGGRDTMRNLVSDTCAAFADCGLGLYNEAVLLNAIGTGAMRLNTSFIRGSRKMVRAHQNILIFHKGDPKLAVEGWKE